MELQDKPANSKSDDEGWNEDEWIEIVPPQSFQDAERAFDLWKKNNPEMAKKTLDIEYHIIRALDNTSKMRFVIRKKYFAQTEDDPTKD